MNVATHYHLANAFQVKHMWNTYTHMLTNLHEINAFVLSRVYSKKGGIVSTSLFWPNALRKVMA